VADWELGTSAPLASSWGVIARVLGEDLLPEEGEIGSRLRTARWRLGLTQTEMATRVGLDPRTIRNTEQGRYRPSKTTREKLVTIPGFAGSDQTAG
jgi:DNA-binding XRE family transcriptional regulator